jgi:ribonuclease HI
MQDLHNFGIRGRLAYFISSFLKDRQFKVRVGNTLSDPHEQEMGVPQGCILSVTLFSVKINSIVKAVNPGIECFLYVDDFCICYRSKHMHTIERQLQQVLNNLHKWSNENGFKFSKTKTKCMHFCNVRKLHLDPELTLDNTPIEVVKEFKFLGLVFDSKLSFIPHIKYLSDKCQRALNLIRVVSSMDWGADREVLLRLYRSLIRSKLDYGCIVYGSARNSYIKKLDTIHNQGLRLALGAFRTSPIASLYAEANEPSLYLRRQKLGLHYFLKLKSNPKNPTYKTVFSPMYDDLFQQRENTIPPFSLRNNRYIESLNIDLNDIETNQIPDIPPWIWKSPQFIYDLAKSKKETTIPEIFKVQYNEIKQHFYNYEYIYTDGSKQNNRVAAAAVTEDETFSFRLPDNSSVFSAELKAIELALNHIETEGYMRYLIFTDSLSAMQALDYENTENPLVVNLLQKISYLLQESDIIFCWLPGHIGIQGNEAADKAAKTALNNEILPFKVPYCDFKPLVNSFVKTVWQTSWEDPLNHNNKLFSIKPVLGECPLSSRSSRREEIVLCRIRIGHSYLTHSYLLKGEEAPQCIPCFTELNLSHIFIHCVDLAHIRNKYFSVQTMSDLFNTVTPDLIFNFLKEINLFKKI